MTPEEEKKLNNPTDPAAQTPPDGAADFTPPKTQEELDAIVEKCLARERKKLLVKQPPAPPAAQAAPLAVPVNTDAASAATQPAVVDTSAMDSVNRDLMIAKAQIAAMKDGVVPGAVEDAVYLAVMQAEKAGEADEDGVADALKEVLKRHPEWKAQSKKDDVKGGFKIGVDTAVQQPGQKKALPTGKVIF